MDSLGALLPLLLLVAVFYFLIIRPSRRRQQEQREVQTALAPGAKVMTASGMLGTVTSVDAERVELEVADGVRVGFVPAAIAKVLPDAPAGMPEPASSVPPEDDTPHD